MIVSKVVREFEEYQFKKLNAIALAALMSETNLKRALQSPTPEEKEELINLAIENLKFIHNDLTKNDFKTEEIE